MSLILLIHPQSFESHLYNISHSIVCVILKCDTFVYVFKSKRLSRHLETFSVICILMDGYTLLILRWNVHWMMQTAIHTTVWKVASLCNITLINSAIHHYPSLPCRPFLSDPSVCDGTWKRLPARQISRVGAFGCPSLITHSGPGGGLRRCRRTEGSSERRHHPHTSARHNRERKLCTLKVQQNVSCAV